jgi:hypothetical protein
LREEVFAEQSLKESKYLLKKNAIKNSENLLGKKPVGPWINTMNQDCTDSFKIFCEIQLLR